MSKHKNKRAAEDAGLEPVLESTLEETPETNTEANTEVNVRPALKITGTCTSIYISDIGIKLLSAGKNGIEKWAAAVLPPGLVSSGQINDPPAVAAALSKLVTEHGFKHDKVVAGMSGLHSISRVVTLPAAARGALDEAIHHEAERGLPVKPDSIYLYWQVIKNTGDELKVFVIAYQRNVIDAMVTTLRLAGFTSFVLELIPLALLRNADSQTSAVFDVRPGEFDIVGIKDNFPEVVRSLPLAAGISGADSMPVIKEELERTLRYFCPGHDDDTVMIVQGSGIYNNGHDVYGYLTERLGAPVKPLTHSPGFPEDFPVTDYTINLGLVLRAAPGKELRNRPRINLLPRKPKKKPVGLGYIALAVAAIGVAVGGIYVLQLNNQHIAQMSAALTETEGILTSHVDSQRAVQELATRLDEALAAPAALEAIREGFTESNRLLNEDMQNAVALLPEGVFFTTIRHENRDGLVIEGTAKDQGAALAYSQALMESGSFSGLAITDIYQNSEDTGIFFRFILTR